MRQSQLFTKTQKDAPSDEVAKKIGFNLDVEKRLLTDFCGGYINLEGLHIFERKGLEDRILDVKTSPPNDERKIDLERDLKDMDFKSASELIETWSDSCYRVGLFFDHPKLISSVDLP